VAFFNEREPHLVKVGRANKSAEQRARELRTTGVPGASADGAPYLVPLSFDREGGGLDDLEMASLEWVETPTSARAIGRILPAEAEATYYS
jgi:hypothetical protein